MAVTNNLYPPIVDTYMPAFLIKDNSDDREEITKYYVKVSYAGINAYNQAVDEYITGSTAIFGVQELWDEYEIELALVNIGTSVTVPIKQKYIDIANEVDPENTYPETIINSTSYPDIAAAKQELKRVYDLILKTIISGDPNERITELTFFTEEPSPVIDRPRPPENPTEGPHGIVETIKNGGTPDNDYVCKMYFSLSSYNTINEIANAQVTIRKQSNNANVVNTTKYYSGIMLKKIKEDNSRKTNDKYYIEIYPEDLENCNFIIDEYYKVQIRFTSTSAEDINGPRDDSLKIDLNDRNAIQAIDTWLNSNLSYFSEWSSVCLIRGISAPTLNIKDFGYPTIYESVINTQVIGNLTFADENETETLKSYRVKVFKKNTNELLVDSGELFTDNFTDVNSFIYTIKYWFEANIDYLVRVIYTTQNLYVGISDTFLSVEASEKDNLGLEVYVYKDEENGRLALNVKKGAKTTFTGQIIIRRASSKDNYKIWDDLYTTNYKDALDINYLWYDYTVECGVWYMYGVQVVDSNGVRRPMVFFRDPIMLVFDDIFLTSNNKQLKIKYNPSISSFKHTISEIKIETIGEKYPFIKRNGVMDYIQFPLGGMIFSMMDEDGTFVTKDELYQDFKNNYEEYNTQNNIPAWSDIVWEKFFREKVIKFLYDGEVKLFRSPTEGNILIRLMDISFQPNQQLGRRLWSFTSTAYEIAECNLDNYSKYNIINLNDGKTFINSGGDTPGTLAPISKIVFVTEETFPNNGREGVLYVKDKQFYLYDESNNKYKMISISRWNPDEIEMPTISGAANILYTDNDNDLYMWDSYLNTYDKISVSRYNEGLEEEMEG